MRRSALRAFAGASIIALAALTHVPAGASEQSIPVRRWLGAESGFEEIACLGLGSGCPGFRAGTAVGGAVSTPVSTPGGTGATLPWTSRTGMRHFLATVPGGAPSVAALDTSGSGIPAAAPVTVAFAVRLAAAPVTPLPIFRHAGGSPVHLVVSPGGQLVVDAGGLAPGGAGVLSPGAWHTVTITYGAEAGAGFKVYLDGALLVSGVLPLGGPTGAISLGIVEPTTAPASVGIDDYVEVPRFDAPIHGARIGYAIPDGQSGPSAWTPRGDPACTSAADSWEVLTEDRVRTVRGATCDMGANWLFTNRPQVVENLHLEGFPSGHAASPAYARVPAQPRGADPVLGVRVRVRATVEDPTRPLIAGVLEGRVALMAPFSFLPGHPTWAWGPTYHRRPSDTPWSAIALDWLRVRLHSGKGSFGRVVDDVRLDYVWVPA